MKSPKYRLDFCGRFVKLIFLSPDLLITRCTFFACLLYGKHFDSNRLDSEEVATRESGNKPESMNNTD